MGHIQLEKALMINKQQVLRLMENDHPTAFEIQRISSLRYDAKGLIRELTREIQCEQRSSLCVRPKECKFIFIRSISASEYYFHKINSRFCFSIPIVSQSQ
jgi:hypothetical protein